MCFEECLEFTPFWAVFSSWERRSKQVVLESPENQGKDTLLYSITSTTVVGWGLCGTFLLLFFTNLCSSNVYKTAFIEGGKVALVNELFCVPLLPTIHVTFE